MTIVDSLSALILYILFRIIQRLLFTKKGIRILMYHQVSENAGNDLTVTVTQLKNHLSYLERKGYHSITMNELIKYLYDGTLLPPNPVLITFDDGYASVLKLAYPLLQYYQMKATLFIPTFFIGKRVLLEKESTEYLDIQQLRNIDGSVLEVGLHSHTHSNYRDLSTEQIKNDLRSCLNFFNINHVTYVPAFAYPYGGRPKRKIEKELLQNIFVQDGIKIAFRIGNRVNPCLPAKLYELERMDIKGCYSLRRFKIKLKGGKFSSWLN